LWCDNVDSDPYVDRESCRGLGIKSVIAAPILSQGRVEGVIEVFSRDVYGFTEADCLALQEIATGVAESLVPRESRRRFGT
jgi:putative methionine-R-sulfoxide reductase with GAF domain